MTDPILISGAGPSGLILALSLAKHGIPVRIIDKELTPRLGERGSGIMPQGQYFFFRKVSAGESWASLQPRSLEVHRLLGTLPDILQLATPPPVMRQWDPADPTKLLKTTMVAPPAKPTPQIPFISPLILGQAHQEHIFRSHLEKLGVSVELGAELRSFKEVSGLVTGEIIHQIDGKERLEQFKAPWLIGTDGARSTVRKSLGLEFVGETRESDIIALVDIKVKGDILQFWDRFGHPSNKVANLRPSGRDDHIVQLLIAGEKVDTEKVLTSRETIIEEFYEISGRRDIVFEDVVWTSKYRPNIRMVNQLRVGHILLAGDAAHCHSPVGGQGLNSSIQDSFNLGWKLALVYKGFASPSLLDTYTEERLPIIAEMLGKTTELYNQARATGGSANRGAELSQLVVNYRGSSIIYEDNADVITAKGKGYNDDSVIAARPGDRAPDAPGLVDVRNNEVFSIYDVLSATQHSVLLFSNKVDNYSALLEVIKRLPGGIVRTALILPKGAQVATASQEGLFDKILVDGLGQAYTGYHVDQASDIAVVRPDGVVGARVLGIPGLERYLQGILI